MTAGCEGMRPIRTSTTTFQVGSELPRGHAAARSGTGYRVLGLVYAYCVYYYAICVKTSAEIPLTSTPCCRDVVVRHSALSSADIWSRAHQGSEQLVTITHLQAARWGSRRNRVPDSSLWHAAMSEKKSPPTFLFESTFWNAACSSVARRAAFFIAGSANLYHPQARCPVTGRRCFVGFVLNRGLQRNKLEAGYCHWN